MRTVRRNGLPGEVDVAFVGEDLVVGFARGAGVLDGEGFPMTSAQLHRRHAIWKGCAFVTGLAVLLAVLGPSLG